MTTRTFVVPVLMGGPLRDTRCPKYANQIEAFSGQVIDRGNGEEFIVGFEADQSVLSTIESNSDVSVFGQDFNASDVKQWAENSDWASAEATGQEWAKAFTP